MLDEPGLTLGFLRQQSTSTLVLIKDRLHEDIDTSSDPDEVLSYRESIRSIDGILAARAHGTTK